MDFEGLERLPQQVDHGDLLLLLPQEADSCSRRPSGCLRPPVVAYRSGVGALGWFYGC